MAALNAEEAGEWVEAYMTYGPDGAAVGEPSDGCGPLVTTSGPVAMGELNLSVGQHILGPIVTGKNPEPSGCSFGIDCLSLVPLD
jgi:hypothetical protein